MDIGGGHFLDVRRPDVNEFLFRFMSENEWNLFVRNSKIKLKDKMIDHPIEANIWQLSIDEQIKYLTSIAKAGCTRGENKPEKFVDWILWKLGTEITNEYMIPYNTYGIQPGHAQFYYPKKYGYGEIWKRMADTLGEHIAYNTQVKGIEFGNNIVFANDGRRIKGEKVITTIPWKELETLDNMPNELCNEIKKLKYSSLYIKYYKENCKE